MDRTMIHSCTFCSYGVSVRFNYLRFCLLFYTHLHIFTIFCSWPLFEFYSSIFYYFYFFCSLGLWCTGYLFLGIHTTLYIYFHNANACPITSHHHWYIQAIFSMILKARASTQHLGSLSSPSIFFLWLVFCYWDGYMLVVYIFLVNLWDLYSYLVALY